MPIPAPSQAVVKKLAIQLGVVPHKEAGQNFLIDPSVAQRVLREAQVEKNDTVLEIGPGFGWLTQELAGRVERVVAVELEKRFIPWLKTRLPHNVTVINESILTTDLTRELPDRGYVLVSFLPYSITAKVFRQFLTQSPRPRRIVMVIQKEVAQRICAEAGNHSKLSILVQRYSTPRLITTIGAEKFWPKPAVDSAIVVCDLTSNVDASSDEFFWRMVRIGFSSKRKTLLNNFINGLHVKRDDINKVLLRANLSEKTRPQELTITQWDTIISLLDRELKNN